MAATRCAGALLLGAAGPIPRGAAPPRAPRQAASLSGARLLVRRAPRAAERPALCVAQKRAEAAVHAVAGARAAAQRASSSKDCPRGATWVVHKFGGTCMGSAERIKAAVALMKQQHEAMPDQRTLVVVSAMGGVPKVTDMLLGLVAKAAKRDPSWAADLESLRLKHAATAAELLGASPAAEAFNATLAEDCGNLRAMLRAIAIAGASTGSFVDYVIGHGELWSAQLFNAAANDGRRAVAGGCAWLDARRVLTVTDSNDGSVDVDYDASSRRLDAWWAEHASAFVVATGFVAETPEGVPTTLKRNGSDYSATAFGALLRCRRIVIWTDVDGVYSADPRKVRDAVCLDTLSYNEAWELSYFGANVLHPRTTLPAMKYGIPVEIRNFFNLSAPGTVISERGVLPPPEAAPAAAVPVNAVRTNVGLRGLRLVKGFATIDQVTLINVEGTGMVGVPGTASSIFSAVRDAQCNVIMISQASSEHSICFAVKGHDAPAAVAAVRAKFANSLAAGRISDVTQIDNCSILAAVGQQMASTHGVSAVLFSALARAGVNIKAIAQGCSEYNITVVVDGANSARALRAVHSRFYLSETPISVGVVGPGLIGGTLLRQLHAQAKKLHDEFNIDVRVTGIADSKRMLLSDAGVDLSNWESLMATQGVPADMAAFAKHVQSDSMPNTAIVDCTSSGAVADCYETWLGHGIHVITPNKKAGSGPLRSYLALKAMQRSSYTHYFYEATVGAGLPIMTTLRSILETGDSVVRIEGILSGTLSYIFNALKPGLAFSDIVKEAKAKGYTEPDPRDDLSGSDVARKVVILARESGLAVEMADVPVSSLVPPELQAVATSAEYMARLPEFDAAMAKQVEDAAAAGQVLRYVGVVDAAADGGKGKCSVELKRYPAGHPFAQLVGTDNIILFTTARYNQQPLVIRGPGAGAEVTAAGIFGDLLRLAAYLGAPS